MLRGRTQGRAVYLRGKTHATALDLNSTTRQIHIQQQPSFKQTLKLGNTSRFSGDIPHQRYRSLQYNPFNFSMRAYTTEDLSDSGDQKPTKHGKRGRPRKSNKEEVPEEENDEQIPSETYPEDHQEQTPETTESATDLAAEGAQEVDRAGPKHGGIAEDQPAEHHDTTDSGMKLQLGTNLPPKKIVAELDRFIVGQYEAKRAVAIALRNRWRRHKLQKSLREEVVPKNILMVGPTGVGKTEIARRLAKLAEAPFIKVEATKFTEVGFHGRDVDQIIRDLVDVSMTQTKERLKEEAMPKARAAAEERILDALVGDSAQPRSRQVFRDMLQKGEIDNNIIDIELPVPQANQPSPNEMPQGGAVSLNDIGSILYKLSPMGGSGRKTRKESLPVKDAMQPLIDAEAEKLVKTENIQAEAIRAVEENGIVFIDEIDKIVTKSEYRDGHDASSEGVQRDLLPLIEGTTISTKYGNVKTEHILFICSGAFHSVKPSDMLAELQGRLPIRVELKGLTRNDLYRILTEPEQNLIRQNVALLGTEDVKLTFTEDAIQELARVAAEVNSSVENIGARRLHTVLERIMEDVSFSAPDLAGEDVTFDKADIQKHMESMLSKTDLTKFIL